MGDGMVQREISFR
jgi:hypothetical protein